MVPRARAACQVTYFAGLFGLISIGFWPLLDGPPDVQSHFVWPSRACAHGLPWGAMKMNVCKVEALIERMTDRAPTPLLPMENTQLQSQHTIISFKKKSKTGTSQINKNAIKPTHSDFLSRNTMLIPLELPKSWPIKVGHSPCPNHSSSPVP